MKTTFSYKMITLIKIIISGVSVKVPAADAWGRRVIEHKQERGPAELHEIDYLLHGPQ